MRSAELFISLVSAFQEREVACWCLPDENRLSFWTEKTTTTNSWTKIWPDNDFLSPCGLVKGSVLCLCGGYCAAVVVRLGVSQLSAFSNLLYSYHGVILASGLRLDAFTTLRAVQLKWTFSYFYINQLTDLVKQTWGPQCGIFWFPHTNYCFWSFIQSKCALCNKIVHSRAQL